MKALETSEKILQIAASLFVKKGYTATSMREIAAEAGIGKATIYYHYPDKEAIARALIKRTVYEMQGALKIMEAEDDPRQRIKVAVTYSVEYLLESADIISVVRREVTGSRDVMQHEFKGFFQNYLKLLADGIRTGIDQGIFRAVNPADTARVLLSMIQGTFAMVYLGGEKFQSTEAAAAAILDVFFRVIEIR